MIIIYICGSSEGKQILLVRKTSSLALHQNSMTSLVFFRFSNEGTLCLVLRVFSVVQTTKMSQAESSCNTGMSDLLQQVWKRWNVIYYSLFMSATITLQNPKENNVIEGTCLLPCRKLKQPQARANTDVVQGIKRVLDAVASNYPGI